MDCVDPESKDTEPQLDIKEDLIDLEDANTRGSVYARWGNALRSSTGNKMVPILTVTKIK